jgi:hypothetical protein
VINHFGYNTKSTLIIYPKIPPIVKKKFISCRNIIPARMSTTEVWDKGCLPGSAGIACSSQSAHNNLASDSMPNIDVSASEPPQLQVNIVWLHRTH